MRSIAYAIRFDPDPGIHILALALASGFSRLRKQIQENMGSVQFGPGISLFFAVKVTDLDEPQRARTSDPSTLDLAPVERRLIASAE